MSNSTSLWKVSQDPKRFAAVLRERQNIIAEVGGRWLDPGRVVRVVLNAVTRTPKLMECTGASIIGAVVAAAELGLEPGTVTGEAYLVPFGNEAHLIIGYKGLVKLLYRSGQVKSVIGRVVYGEDVFELEYGIEDRLRHVPRVTDPKPANIVGAYGIVKLVNGGVVIDYLCRADIERHRQASRAASSGPWVTHYPEMAAKTALRSITRWLPLTTEIALAEAVDRAADTGDSTIVREVSSVVADVVADVVEETSDAQPASQGVAEPPPSIRRRMRSRPSEPEPEAVPPPIEEPPADANLFSQQ